jgi:iron uptake system EfeUOB component EfeO/EfeM
MSHCTGVSRAAWLPDLAVVTAPKRTKSIALFAAALAIVVGVALLVVPGLLGTSGSGGDRACSSYPALGAPAPGGTTVPASIADQYSVLRRSQQAPDKLTSAQITSALGSSGNIVSGTGMIMSGTRFLGDAAFGGRIYLVPAQHLLSYRLAPLRCLTASQRTLEQQLLPKLRSQYPQNALCIVVLAPSGRGASCVAASGSPDSLLFVSGTPGFGLVPDGVNTVTVTYETAPPRTVAVHHNFFVVVAPNQTALPCGVQWLDPTGNVQKIVTGCSYVATETLQLVKYRAYVARQLSTLGSQVSDLATAIGSGDLAQAQSAWLAAHLTWLEIGQDDGAYGAFGTLGGEIDGLAAGHRLGTADPGFTGFHRIEFDLWTKHDLQAAATDTATLQRLLAQLERTPLSTYLPATATGIGNWVLRPHEVLEDALRDSLTANDDYGSGTDLASITADVAAVRELMAVLGPVLNPLAPSVDRQVASELDGLVGAVDATKSNGGWVSIQNVPIRQRQQVDADVGATLETLAPIPDLLTSTGKNAPAS